MTNKYIKDPQAVLDYKIDWNSVRDISVPIISKFTFRTNGTCQTPR